MTSQATMLSDLATIYLRDPSNNLFPTAIITHCLQKAYEHVQHDLQYACQECDEEYTVPIVAGTATYALPTDFVTLRTVTVAGGYLSGTDKPSLARRFIDLTTQGPPRRYYLDSGYLGFYPVPSTAPTTILYYSRRLPTLSSVQASLFPSYYDETVYRYAAYLCWAPVDQNKAMFELQQYNICADKLRREGLYIDENVAFTVTHNTSPSVGLDTVLPYS